LPDPAVASAGIPIQQTVQRIEQALNAFRDGNRQTDDMTLVAIEFE